MTNIIERYITAPVDILDSLELIPMIMLLGIGVYFFAEVVTLVKD